MHFKNSLNNFVNFQNNVSSVSENAFSLCSFYLFSITIKRENQNPYHISFQPLAYKVKIENVVRK